MTTTSTQFTNIIWSHDLNIIITTGIGNIINYYSDGLTWKNTYISQTSTWKVGAWYKRLCIFTLSSLNGANQLAKSTFIQPFNNHQGRKYYNGKFFRSNYTSWNCWRNFSSGITSYSPVTLTQNTPVNVTSLNLTAAIGSFLEMFGSLLMVILIICTFGLALLQPHYLINLVYVE